MDQPGLSAGTNLAVGHAMHHHIAHTVRHRLLFRTWHEGLYVWHRVVALVPDLLALCLMPDHLHLIARRDVRAPLGRVLGGVARHRNAAERVRGPLFHPVPPPAPIPDAGKLRRQIRYIHLNPCRADLVADPLAWPLSTHRDSVGLTTQRVGPPRNPTRFHAYVSGDPTVSVHGTELPTGASGADQPERVLAAVSAVTRTPAHALGRRLRTRALTLAALRELCPTSQQAAARLLAVNRSTLRDTPSVPRNHVRIAASVLGDPRFAPLDATWLPRTWRVAR